MRLSDIRSFPRKHPASAILTVILTTYFFFGLQHIGSFITADEHYWVEERIPQYWEAWSEGKWKKTLINDKPGISLALISGPALLLHDETGLGCQEKDGRFSGCDPRQTTSLYTSFRFPILLFNAILLVSMFFSIRAFSGTITAGIAVWLIATSPHLIGMSQIVNPDSLLWSSGAAALFAFTALLKTGKKSFGISTAALLLLALLSKYTAIILIFFLPFLALAIRFIDPKFSPIGAKKKLFSLMAISLSPFLAFPILVPGVLSSEERIRAFLTAGTGSFLSWLGYAALLGILAIAAYFRIPKKIEKILTVSGKWFFRAFTAALLVGIVSLVVARFAIPDWDIFERLPFDIKNLTNARYYLDAPVSPVEVAFLELSPITYALPMMTLALTLFSIGYAVIARKRQELPLTLILSFFVVLHLAALGFSNVLATPRYEILLFPVFALLAAFGVKEFQDLLPKRFREVRYASIALAFIAVIPIGSLLSSKPYYTNFSNALLPEKSLIAHSWGYGGYEAAEYLNSLPDAEHITVWSDYYGVCEFFVGRCLTAYTFDPGIDPDYYVLTRRGKLRYMPKYDNWETKSGLKAYQYYERNDPAFGIAINGKPGNFVKVFRVDKTFRASIVTDIDYCSTRSPEPVGMLGAFTSFVDERASDFSISLGDNLSHRLQDCSKHYRTDLPTVVDHLSRSKARNHWVLGDHDIASSDESYTFWKEQVRQEPFYSFDEKDVHVVVLDTVAGGEPLVKTCEATPSCQLVLAEKNQLKELLGDWKKLFAYAKETGVSTLEIRKRHAELEKIHQNELSIIKTVRDANDRDRGMILDRQLEWLKQDIGSTGKTKVVVFSDHPLFPFVSYRKSYDIVNGDRVRDILETSGKEVVAVSGEAHLWHEEIRNGIRYFIVDQFGNANGSWAFLSWPRNGEPTLEQITH